MNYRTQKILLTGKISDELRDYFVWLCHQSNNLYNSALYQIRQTHFDRGGCSWSRSISNHGVESCPTYSFFDENDCYRVTYKNKLIKASYAQLCKDFKENKHYQALGGQQAQQCLKSVVEAISSYNKLIRCWWRGELNRVC